jgi:type II secretory pathway pseudopilin PulG
VSGFALVEVMMSVTLLVIGVLGLLSSLVAARHVEQGTAAHSVRMRVANRAIEQLRNGSLVTATQGFVAHSSITQSGQTVTLSFLKSTLTKDLPTYTCATSPFQSLNGSPSLSVVAANAANPGLLPIRITITGGGGTTVFETLAANR